MNKSSRQLGFEEGLEEVRQELRQAGLLDGAILCLTTVLEERFGPLSEKTYILIRALTYEEIARIFRPAIRANSLSELGLE